MGLYIFNKSLNSRISNADFNFENTQNFNKNSLLNKEIINLNKLTQSQHLNISTKLIEFPLKLNNLYETEINKKYIFFCNKKLQKYHELIRVSKEKNIFNKEIIQLFQQTTEFFEKFKFFNFLKIQFNQDTEKINKIQLIFKQS